MTRDGLDPPGEQLELPWGDDAPTPPELTEVIRHRVAWDASGWSCACGAGADATSVGRAHGAAALHVRAVRRRNTDRP